MTEFRTIVVAIDFDELSEIEWNAAREFGGPETTFIALNVVPIPPLPDVAYSNIPAAMEEQRHENEAKLARFEHAVGGSARVEPRVVLGGDIVSTIIDVARESAADLIIIGKRRRGKRFAEKLTRKAPCPVVVVKRAA